MSVPHRDVTPRSMPPATSILVNGDTCSVRATRLDLILAELGYGEGRVATQRRIHTGWAPRRDSCCFGRPDRGCVRPAGWLAKRYNPCLILLKDNHPL
jgi:hypothetical protein